MKLLRHALALSALFFLGSPARATSILPPSFPELVAEADAIVRGTVTDVRSVAVESSRGPTVHTLVTLRVERALKGTPGETVTLTFLGGTVGRRTLTVDGQPRFQVGDRTIVFYANNGRTICPVIGMRHGRFHVQRDTGTDRDYVARDNGQPLASADDVPLPFASGALTRTVAAAPAAALTPADFEAQIAAALQAQRLTGKTQ